MVCVGCTERTLVISFTILLFVLCSASVNGLQIVLSNRLYESTRDYSKKDISCVTGKWWPNSILMCIFHICFHYFCPSTVHAAKLYSLG